MNRMRKSATLSIPLAALVAFGASLFSGFHFDDYGMLQDPAVLSLHNWTLWQTRPLTWFTFWLNYRISGRDPFSWHAVNLVIHIACALLLYRLLDRLMPKAALLGALIFALHPIQSEAVDYIYARAILLCALFSILTIDAWTRHRPWLAVAWFALAVLSKEECAAVPIVLALYSLRKHLLPLAAMFATSLLAGLHVIAAIQATGMTNVGASAGISPVAYLSEQGIAILRYLGLLVFPWFFSIDPQIPTPAGYWRLLAWIVLALLIAAAVRRFRQVPAAFWIVAGFILLIPSSSLFPAADLAADRRMYLPMLAFAPAIALLLPMRPVLIAILLAALSLYRTHVWQSDERLWQEAVDQAPGKLRPILQLSRAVPPDRAIELLKQAERSSPDAPQIPTELARVDLQLNHPAEALAQAGRVLALAPRDPRALNNRGAVLLALNQTDAARADFLEALRLDPCLEEARDNLRRIGGIPPDAPRCRSSLH